MIDVVTRNPVEADYDRILALNDQVEVQTSSMDRDHLILLMHLSSYTKVATIEGELAGFLLTIQDDADYTGENYVWFCSHFSNFIYVDRIVVASQFVGLGIGSALYKQLFSHAQLEALRYVTCEYNVEPLNVASKAFHERFHFKQVATRWVSAGTKRVSLQVAETEPIIRASEHSGKSK